MGKVQYSYRYDSSADWWSINNTIQNGIYYQYYHRINCIYSVILRLQSLVSLSLVFVNDTYFYYLLPFLWIHTCRIFNVFEPMICRYICYHFIY